MLSVILAMTLLCGCVCLQTPQKVSAKAVSKVTKTIELTSKNIRKTNDKEYQYDYEGTGITHKISMKENEKLKVKVKVLEVEGKVFSKYYTRGRKYDFGLGAYDPNIEKGDVYVFDSQKKPKLKKSFFKEGQVLQSKPIKFIKPIKQTEKNLEKLYASLGTIVNDTKTDMQWYSIPGITKMKLQITYYTQSGKAGIRYVKERKDI